MHSRFGGIWTHPNRFTKIPALQTSMHQTVGPVSSIAWSCGWTLVKFTEVPVQNWVQVVTVAALIITAIWCRCKNLSKMGDKWGSAYKLTIAFHWTTVQHSIISLVLGWSMWKIDLDVKTWWYRLTIEFCWLIGPLYDPVTSLALGQSILKK